jgi:hypothetical protein
MSSGVMPVRAAASMAAPLHAAAPFVGRQAGSAAHPNFSGTWTYDPQATLESIRAVGAAEFANPTNIFGDSFVAVQTDAQLSMKITVGPMAVTAVYKLDGTESRNASPPGTPDGAPIIVTSTAKWEGTHLLIASTSQSEGSGRGSVNGMITVRSTRQVFLDDKGRLVIDRTGTPRTVVPNSRSVYVKK